MLTAVAINDGKLSGKVRCEGREEVLFEVRCGGRRSTDLNWKRIASDAGLSHAAEDRLDLYTPRFK
jgi:hypothetical protein